MLEAPPVWNVVPDLMMEVEDGRMKPEAAIKQRRDESGPRVEETVSGEKRISDPRSMNIFPRFPRGHVTQQDSIQRSGTSYSKKT